MTGKTMIYAGLIIPATIVDQIEAKALASYPDSAELRAAFEVGALMAYVGRTPSLGISTPRAEAYRDGQVYGSSLRSVRCHRCKGRGISDCGTIICRECDGSGAERERGSFDERHAAILAGMKRDVDALTVRSVAALQADIEATLAGTGIVGTVHVLSGGAR